MSRLLLEGMTEIHAPANQVWTILTDSTFIQQYMLGCVVETSWKQGSPLLWKGAADGHLYVKGDVVAIDALHRLEYTVLGVDLKIADVPQNYLTITYELKKNNKSSTQLYVSMGDFNAVSGSKARYDETIASDGWTPRLGKIKQLAENP